MNSVDIARDGLILRSIVGSTAHGLNLPGSVDTDVMGVCMEPPEYVIGLKQFEQSTSRTQPDGESSGHGDVDQVIYSLRKFCRLALKGNPTIITLLYVKPDYITPLGEDLLSIRDSFASRGAGRAFLGYMTQQRERLTGERGQKNVKRPELVDQYGFDTKYAMHMLRLGFQGVQYLSEGQLSLPMREPERSFIYSVRLGEVTLDETVAKARELETELEGLLTSSPLPEKPDYDTVNEFLVDSYVAGWRSLATASRLGRP